MAVIEFSSQFPSFKFSGTTKTSNWLKVISEKEGKLLQSLVFVFCTDDFLLDLNKKYLSHSTFTDILTFDLSEGSGISGEIYISIPRVRENAKEYKESFDNELRRVMAHGLLHLLGYKDKSSSQKALMRRKEKACLSLWK